MAASEIHSRRSPPIVLPSRPITFHRTTQSGSSAPVVARHDSSSYSQHVKPVSAPTSPRRRAFAGIDAMSPLEELNGFRLGPAITTGALAVSVQSQPDAPPGSTKKSPMSRRRYLRIDSDSDNSSGSMTATPNRSALQRSGSSGHIGANGKSRTRNRTRSATSSPTASSLRLSQEPAEIVGLSMATRSQPVPTARPNRHSMLPGDPRYLSGAPCTQPIPQGSGGDQATPLSLQYRNSRSQPDLPSQARSSSEVDSMGSFPPRGSALGMQPAQHGQIQQGPPAMITQQKYEVAARKAALEQWHEHSLWMLRNFGQGSSQATLPAGPSSGVHESTSGSVGRKSPLRQATLPNLTLSPLSTAATMPLSGHNQSGRPLSSMVGAADRAAASVLGFHAPPLPQAPPQSLPASRRTSPVNSRSGPAPSAPAIRPTSTPSPERPATLPPPYTAASSPGEESLSPPISDDGTAEDPADIGVMFTTRARRRRGDASGGETSGDGGLSSPGDGIFVATRGRQPYEARMAAQKSRRGNGHWGPSAYLSPSSGGDPADSERSALGLQLGKLEVPSGDESRYSGDRGVLTTDNEDTLFSPKAPRIASAFATDTAKGRLEDPSLPLVLFVLRLLAAVPAAIGCIRLLYSLRRTESDASSPTAGELLMSIPWAVLTGLYCFDMTTGLTRRWLLYYDLPSTLLRLVSLQTICWPCTAITLGFLGHRQALAGWVLVGTCTAWSRSVQLWVTSNVPDNIGKPIKGSSRPHSSSSKSSVASLASRRGEGTHGITNHAKADWPTNTWQTGSNGARIFIKRRTWDWGVVSRKVAWKLGMLYLVTTWYLLLR